MPKVSPQRPICTGEDGGHIETLTHVRRLLCRPPRYPHLRLEYWQAAQGQPCLNATDPDEPIALIRRGEHAPSLYLPSLHIGAILLCTLDGVPRIIGRPGDDGDMVEETLDLSGLTAIEAIQIGQAWERITAVDRRGRSTRVTLETARTHASHIRRVRRECVHTCQGPNPSQQHLVDYHGDAIGYQSKRGFEDHLKSLRPFGFFWPKSFR